jgi:hypothetical protein
MAKAELCPSNSSDRQGCLAVWSINGESTGHPEGIRLESRSGDFTMPTHNTLVALPCKLSAGAFSGERVIDVKLADGRGYTSVASRHFCWDDSGRLVGEGEPSTEVDGMVAARVLEELDEDQVAVEIPDGDFIAVDRAEVQPRATPIAPPSRTRATPGGQGRR